MMVKRLPRFFLISRLETALTRCHDSLPSSSGSPIRFELLPTLSIRNTWNKIKLINRRGVASRFGSIVDHIWFSFTSLTQNPTYPKKRIDPVFLSRLEKYARLLGVGNIGYCQVPREFIFKDKAVLYEHVIVLTMGMDKDKIELAPSEETALMVFKTYDELGVIANKVTSFLRFHGYAAQAGHPFGGLVLYPAMAELAGLGWHGLHGLTITPEFGPRVRIAAVFTSIENLPVSEETRHKWVEDFCYNACGRCARKCPPQAILKKPDIYNQKLLRHIDSSRCFPFFCENQGCSICIKECPFSRHDYNKIKESFFPRKPMQEVSRRTLTR